MRLSLCLSLGAGALYTAGRYELWRARQQESEQTAAWPSNLDPAVVASVLPGSHEDAMRMLDYVRRDGRVSDGPGFAAGCRELYRLAGGVPAIAERLAPSCERTRVESAIEEGRFAELTPSEVAETSDPTSVHIARGEWHEAALTADGGSYARPCLAALLRSYAGEPTRFETLQYKPDDDTCRLVAALLLPPEPRRAALAAMVELGWSPGYYHSVTYACELLVMAGGQAEYLITASLDAIFQGYVPDSIWLTPWMSLDATDLGPRGRDGVATNLATLELLRGHPARARTVMASFADPSNRRNMAAVVDLIEGRPVTTTTGELVVGYLRAHSDIARYAPRLGSWYRCTSIRSARASAADDADGGPLAAWLQQCPGVQLVDVQELLYGLVPRISTHRGELALAIRSLGSDRSSSIFTSATQAAVLRNLANLIGDASEADRQAAAFARFDAVLSDARKTIALLLN